MKLLLDIGNTRVKWATLEDGRFSHHGEFVHRERSGFNLDRLRQQVVAKPSAVLVANVAGSDLAEVLEHTVEDAWGVDVEYAATRETAAGVRAGYRDIRQLGVDRWLAIIAAYRAHQRPVCVVDAGTAVTVDHVDGSGQHLGGVIVPGYGLMQQALRTDTGDIRQFADMQVTGSGSDDALFAHSTAEAISGGARVAIVRLVEHAFDRLRHGHGDGVLVVTGGDAERLMRDLTSPADHRPMLVLDGLAAIG